MKISVIVPAFNSERFLDQAVKSVLATDYPYLEIIIVEDKSTDKTLEVAEAIEKNSRPS